MAQKYYAFDDELLFRDKGAAALTSTGYIGTQIDQGEAVLTEYVLVVGIEAMKVSAGDEVYTLRVVGSQTADRSDARVLAELPLGDAAAKTIDTADDAVGDQIIIPFRSERPAGENQRYIDLHLTVAGTSPSTQFFAFLSKPQMV